MNTNNLDLQLYNDLDESVLNAIGMNDNMEYTSNFCCGVDGDYSNAPGDEVPPASAGKGVSPETIQAGVQVASSIVQGIQQSKAAKAAAGIPTRKEIKAACGRKPLLSKKKKQKWNDCRNNYIATKAKVLGGQASFPAAPSVDTGSGTGGGERGGDSESATFLGMPKEIGIAVAVIGGLALIAGGIFLVKRMAK
jgi:hypothetical protein